MSVFRFWTCKQTPTCLSSLSEYVDGPPSTVCHSCLNVSTYSSECANPVLILWHMSEGIFNSLRNICYFQNSQNSDLPDPFDNIKQILQKALNTLWHLQRKLPESCQ